MQKVVGPPPPPLPPPLKTMPHHTHVLQSHQMEIHTQNNANGANDMQNDDSDVFDSDSGLEVVEEPTLRPSELVRSNHNRTMSTISGKLYFFCSHNRFDFLR